MWLSVGLVGVTKWHVAAQPGTRLVGWLHPGRPSGGRGGNRVAVGVLAWRAHLLEDLRTYRDALRFAGTGAS